MLVSASVLVIGMGWQDDSVLLGPRFPSWGCSKCGNSAKWASRIKCKCGVAAPTRIVQAAKREAAAIKVQPANAGAPRARGKWTQGPLKRDDELSKLRAENAKLREAAKNGGADVEGGDVVVADEEETSIDLQKAHAAYLAIVAAFGANSKQAKDLESDVEKLRESKHRAKPISLQLRIAEGKVRDKKKQLDAARKVHQPTAPSNDDPTQDDLFKRMERGRKIFADAGVSGIKAGYVEL